MKTTVNHMMFVNVRQSVWSTMVTVDGECLSSMLEPKEIKAINQALVTSSTQVPHSHGAAPGKTGQLELLAAADQIPHTPGDP